MKVLGMERVAERTMTTTCSALRNEECIRPRRHTAESFKSTRNGLQNSNPRTNAILNYSEHCEYARHTQWGAQHSCFSSGYIYWPHILSFLSAYSFGNPTACQTRLRGWSQACRQVFDLHLVNLRAAIDRVGQSQPQDQRLDAVLAIVDVEFLRHWAAASWEGCAGGRVQSKLHEFGHRSL